MSGHSSDLQVNPTVLSASLEELYDHAPCGFIVTRLDGAILQVNQTFVDWIGYSREELVESRRFQDLLTLPGKIFYENQYFPILRMQGAAKEIAFDLACRGRDPLPVLVSAIQHTAADGASHVIASVIFDATERRAYERELLLSRMRAEQLSAIVTQSSDAIISITPTGTIQTWNAAAERLFDIPAGQAIGSNLRDLLEPPLDDAAWSRLLAELQTEQSLLQEFVARGADGRHLDISAGFTPHTDMLGTLSSISVIIRDIGERRRIERLQQEFLAMTSHELRTPLAGIRATAQLMQRRGAYNERAVEAIVTQTDRLARLIDDLLLASLVESDRFEPRLEPTDIVAEARVAADYLALGGATITVDAADESLVIPADRQRIGQILTNLLTNAVKYSPEGSEVTVRVRRDADEARIAVIDRGIGIPPDAIPRLFERFYRAAGTADQASGLGLGLHISRRIVAAHGGRIEVESTPGEGSTFTIVLPITST